MKFFEKIDNLILCKFPIIWKYKLHILTIFMIIYFFLIRNTSFAFFEKNKFITEIFLPFLFLVSYLKYNAFYFFEEFRINFKVKFFDYLKDFLALMYISFIFCILFNVTTITLNLNYSYIEYMLRILFLLLFNIISLKFLKLKKFFILYILGLTVLILLGKFFNFIGKDYLFKSIIFIFMYSYKTSILIIFIFLSLMLIYFLKKNSFIDLIYNLYLFILFIIIFILFKDNEILKNNKIGIMFLFLFCVIQYIGLIILNSFPKRV